MTFKFNTRKPARLTLTATASLFALALAACGQNEGPADKVGQNVDRSIEQAASSAGQKAEEARIVVTERAAEAGKALDDATLTAKVKTALIADPNVKALAIDVETKDGVVTLHGTTDNMANRDRASQIASSVEGVRSVLNNLKVVSGS
jgi:hyperosmotically inducible periplasmic protein